MAELRLSEAAASDLNDIRSNGNERFGKAAAERHMHSIRQGIALLADRPFAGQERPEFRDGIRTISRHPHRILYVAADDLVTIIRVLHHARDVQDALGGKS